MTTPHHPQSPYTEHWECQISPQEAECGAMSPAVVEAQQVSGQGGNSGGKSAGEGSKAGDVASVALQPPALNDAIERIRLVFTGWLLAQVGAAYIPASISLRLLLLWAVAEILIIAIKKAENSPLTGWMPPKLTRALLSIPCDLPVSVVFALLSAF